MLGHESAPITRDVYAELFDSGLSAAAEKFDEIMVWAICGQNPARRST